MVSLDAMEEVFLNASHNKKLRERKTFSDNGEL
jgi:hypothetical protein